MDTEAQNRITRKLKSSFYDGGILVNPYSLNAVAKSILRTLYKLGYRELPKKFPLISRERAESAVGDTDCSERKYTPDEREDLVRTVIDGAEIQRDMDWFDQLGGR